MLQYTCNLTAGLAFCYSEYKDKTLKYTRNRGMHLIKN